MTYNNLWHYNIIARLAHGNFRMKYNNLWHFLSAHRRQHTVSITACPRGITGKQSCRLAAAGKLHMWDREILDENREKKTRVCDASLVTQII